MDWNEFPTLNSLRAFSTVTETLSFTQAAISLNVTHAAVSQQVKALEGRMGLTLIERKGYAFDIDYMESKESWTKCSISILN